jgi:transposase-like protein
MWTLLRRSTLASLVEETMQPGMSVSFVARRAGIAPTQLFAWQRRMLELAHSEPVELIFTSSI